MIWGGEFVGVGWRFVGRGREASPRVLDAMRQQPGDTLCTASKKNIDETLPTPHLLFRHASMRR